ncbi:MAG: 3'-5' exonuclease, partial [Actinomycetes bacterium]
PFQKRSHRPLAEQPGVRALLPVVQKRAAEGPGGTIETFLERAVRDLLADAPDPTALLAAAELLRPLALRSGCDLDAFLAEAALGGEVDAWDPRAERVSLLTLHASKGLEFPVVFLVGCEDGLLPLRFGPEPSPTETAEERRLFFVGMTRARSHLFLSHARRRAWRGSVREAEPSPFLADLQAALVDHAQAPARRHPRPPAGDQLSLL